MKQSGRIGSSAIKGAGYDLSKISESEIGLTLATGHGERLIERQLCRRALRKLKKHGFIPDVSKLIYEDSAEDNWDLGLITLIYDTETQKGNVNLIQTASGLLYGFIASYMDKPALLFSKKEATSRFL